MFLQACAYPQGGMGISGTRCLPSGGVSRDIQEGLVCPGEGSCGGYSPSRYETSAPSPHMDLRGVPALVPTHGTQGRGWVSWDLGYGRQAGGTHPTGMLSCISYLLFTVTEPLQTIPVLGQCHRTIMLNVPYLKSKQECIPVGCVPPACCPPAGGGVCQGRCLPRACVCWGMCVCHTPPPPGTKGRHPPTPWTDCENITFANFGNECYRDV